MTVPMVPTLINGKWELLLPEHRAARPEWPHWEQERLASMYANLRPGMTVYDIGAEEGDLPALWASWGCVVVLVEPNPRVWPNIRAVFEANGLTPAGGFVGFAGNEYRRCEGMDPWGEMGTFWLDPERLPSGGHPDHVSGSRTWPECAYGPLIGDHGFCVIPERPDLPCVPIDQLQTAFGPPDALTIDVEGAELEVLHGAEVALREHKPLVWCSVHPEFMRDTFGQSADELHDYMDQRGYHRTLLAIDHEEHWLFWHPDRPKPVLP